MAGLTGVDVVRRLVDRKATYPIILVSGYPPVQQSVQECLDEAPNISFLRKPFTSEELYGEICKHLATSDNPQQQGWNGEP